ncbi:MAG: hypothetical protein KGY70_20480 [Bacteroidales bacterium]|nr:hypothetical protein [Bacteroidales bacterium]
MIKIPDFSRFRNGEFVKFNDLTVSVLNNYDLNALQVSEIAKDVTTASKKMMAVYKADRGSNLTQVIVHADGLRDNMFTAIILILRVHARYHPDETLRKKAKALLKVFEKHGNTLNRQSYHQQTANLQDIFEDIERKGLRGDIESLHLDGYYKQLMASNKEFDRLFLERNKEYAQAPEESMPELREEAESALKNLFNRINAFITIDGFEKYKPLVKEFNALIDNYETSIERRLSKGEAEQDEENELDQDFEEAIE